MALLDRFRNQPPPQPATRPIGGSGRGNVGGVLQLEELNADLQGLRGLQIFDEMWFTDPDVRRVGAMVVNLIVGATWSIEPYGGDDASDLDRRIAEVVRWALWEVMRPNLIEHLGEALPVLIRSGFSPFEKIWMLADYEGTTYLVPRKLGLRLPRSVTYWYQDDFGELSGIKQILPYGPLQNAGGDSMPTIDARDLIYYRVGAEGDNWEGRSLLRPVYKPWFIKDGLEKLDAIACEREGVGVPVVNPPPGATEDQLAALEESLKGLATGEQGYIVFPWPDAQYTKDGSGVSFRIEGHNNQRGQRGAGDSLKYHSDKIAAAFVAEFMRLGQSGEGARATADVQQDPFYAAVEALAGIPEQRLNEDLIEPFVAYNFANAEGAPKLSMSLVDSTSLSELADFTQKLITSGALHPDNDLEDYMRERADLPPASAEERAAREQQEQEDRQMQVEQRQATVDGIKNAPTDDEPPATAARFARQDRPLKSFERHMSLDTIEQAIDGARARFEVAGRDAARQVARRAAQQVVDGEEVDLEAPPELVDALAQELGNLYDTGRQTVVEELDRQRGINVSPATSFAAGDTPDTLRQRAALAAQQIAARIAGVVQRLAISNPNRTQGELQRAGQQEAGAALRAEAQLNAAAALNEGRAAEADVHAHEIEGARYTAILDGAGCGECEAADDDVLYPLDDPGLVQPPNPNCEGGDRCRCMLAYELIGETPPSA